MSAAGDALRCPCLEPTSGLPRQATRQGCGCSAGLSQAGLGGTNQLRQLWALVSGPAGRSCPAGPSPLQQAPGSASPDPQVFPSGLRCPSVPTPASPPPPPAGLEGPLWQQAQLVSLPCLHPKLATPTPALSSPGKDCSFLLGPPAASACLPFMHSLIYSSSPSININRAPRMCRACGPRAPRGSPNQRVRFHVGRESRVLLRGA